MCGLSTCCSGELAVTIPRRRGAAVVICTSTTRLPHLLRQTMHNLDLILTLTGGLATALVLGYLTHRLGLSPIVGYLVGGIVVGPHTPGCVVNQALVEQLAEPRGAPGLWHERTVCACAKVEELARNASGVRTGRETSSLEYQKCDPHKERHQNEDAVDHVPEE
jgi:hypothetical protein